MKVINEPGRAIIKAFVDGVPIEDDVWTQVKQVAGLPFVKGIAVMSDAHKGIGCSVGTVVATEGAISCALAGVDLGCGCIAMRTSLKAYNLPDNLDSLRFAIEAFVPHGRTDNGGKNDKGSWSEIPELVVNEWMKHKEEFDLLTKDYQKLQNFPGTLRQFGTMGGGNHMLSINIEDETQDVWILLHSGSRGIGNAIGSYFIDYSKELMKQYFIKLESEDLSYLVEGTKPFNDYIKLVHWAQAYAFSSRQIMVHNCVEAMKKSGLLPYFEPNLEVVNAHHNYIASEKHFGKKMFVTRKGAIKAGKGDLGVILGHMGGLSHIIEGKGNYQSLMSCSHGAGRAMSRNKAKQIFTLEDHIKATEGVSCRKDLDVIDETPMAYKNFEKVMEAQQDLVLIKHTIREVLTIKG